MFLNAVGFDLSKESINAELFCCALDETKQTSVNKRIRM
jgi:hypothetical protein